MGNLNKTTRFTKLAIMLEVDQQKQQQTFLIKVTASVYLKHNFICRFNQRQFFKLFEKELYL